MEKSYPKELVQIIGGFRRPNENRKSWLVRVAKTAGIGVRSASKAFYDGYMSKNSKEKLELAAKARTSEDDSELILRVYAHIRYLETVDPEMYRADIDAARRFLAHYQDHSSKRVLADGRVWLVDDL